MAKPFFEHHRAAGKQTFDFSRIRFEQGRQVGFYGFNRHLGDGLPPKHDLEGLINHEAPLAG